MREELGPEIEKEEVVLDRKTREGVILMRNGTSSDYGFKIKATHPDNYSVRPSTGILERGAEQVIEIKHIAKSENYQSNKFLLQFVMGQRVLIETNLQKLFSLPGIEKIEKRLSVRYALERKKNENPVKKEESILLIFSALFITYYLGLLLKKMIFGA
ncbi:hypothetical protein NEFER03_0084 [Nematocida sp. LUAm3]|nr:hypothetical protein NEFER03_0084 [Nematocida sp. LUAm3]KAI5173537.1 hypothetical protein NEFER02_0053 [Nematocida sp. LUAm2]KAI5176758.1 hypothetical protein NEFER01_0083 [Nematocida sp. LUAm1]